MEEQFGSQGKSCLVTAQWTIGTILWLELTLDLVVGITHFNQEGQCYGVLSVLSLISSPKGHFPHCSRTQDLFQAEEPFILEANKGHLKYS